MTVIILMGLRRRAAIARTLLARGWRAGTPAAVVLAASTPDMQVWTGRLDALVDARIATGAWSASAVPGTIVVGEVAGLQVYGEILHHSSTGVGA